MQFNKNKSNGFYLHQPNNETISVKIRERVGTCHGHHQVIPALHLSSPLFWEAEMLASYIS